MSDRIRHRVAGKVHSATLLTLLSPSVGGSECRVDCPLPSSSSTPCFLCFSPSLPLLFCCRWAFFKESRNDIGVWDHLSPQLHVTLCTATLLNCVTAVFTRVPQLRHCQHNMFSSFSLGGRQAPVEKKTMFEGTA